MSGVKSMLTFQSEASKSGKSRSSSQNTKLKSGKSGRNWETDMIEVCGKNITLSHPSLEPGAATSEYKISTPKIPLQDDATLVLDGSGTVSASPMGDHAVFTAMGGHVDFRPKNLNRGKGSAELATANIIFSKPDADAASVTEDVGQPDTPLNSEISIYLKTPLVISPKRGFKLELGQGEFVKRFNDPNPKFKFWDTKLTYNDVPITGSFETESDQSGLHLSDPARIWIERNNVAHMKKLPADFGYPSYLGLDNSGFRLENASNDAAKNNIAQLAAEKAAARTETDAAATAKNGDDLAAVSRNQTFQYLKVALPISADISKKAAKWKAGKEQTFQDLKDEAARKKAVRNAVEANIAKKAEQWNTSKEQTFQDLKAELAAEKARKQAVRDTVAADVMKKSEKWKEIGKYAIAQELAAKKAAERSKNGGAAATAKEGDNLANRFSKRVGSLPFKIGSTEFTLKNVAVWEGIPQSAGRAIGFCNGFNIVLTNVTVINNNELTGATESSPQYSMIGTMESISPISGSKFDIKCVNHTVEIGTDGTPRTEIAVVKDEFQTYTLNGVTFSKGGIVSAVEAHCSLDGFKCTFSDAKYRAAGYMEYEQADLESKIDYGIDRAAEKKQIEREQKAKQRYARQVSRAKRRGTPMPKKKTVKPAQQDNSPFFTFKLAKGKLLKGRLPKNSASENMASLQRTKEVTKNKQENTSEQISGTKIDKDIFTSDGFAQLENATFRFVTDEEKEASISGKGQFRFLSIPYNITLSDGTPIMGETQEKDDPEDDAVEFSIDPDGSLNAEVGDGVELSLLKKSNGTESFIHSIVLDGVRVEDGVLRAGALRLYKGANLEIDPSEHTESKALQTIFGMGISGAAAHISRRPPRLGVAGITADTSNAKKKAQFGRFGISNFLGYLSADVDYPAGKIHAELAHENEEDVKFSPIYSKKGNTLFNPELNIPIAPGLNFSFGVHPEVSYGGSLSADLDRHKSFAEDLKEGEPLELKGAFELSGSVGIGLSVGLHAGLAAGNVKILTAGADLTAKATASLGTKMEAAVAFAKKNGKFQQSENLNLSGAVEAALNLSLVFSSSVQFLVWKAEIYSYEIAKKEIKLNPISFTLIKDKDKPGLLNGWNIEEISLSADAFGKKAQVAFADATKDNPKQTLKGKLDASKEALDILGDDVNASWIALEDMKNNPGRGYVLDKEDNDALEAAIKELTDTTMIKLETHHKDLLEHHKLLSQYKRLAEQECYQAELKLKNSKEKAEIWNAMERVGNAGGFDIKNYGVHVIKKQQAMADLYIAQILGKDTLNFEQAKKTLRDRTAEYNATVKKQSKTDDKKTASGDNPKENVSQNSTYQLPDLDIMSEQDFLKTTFLDGKKGADKTSLATTGHKLLQDLSKIDEKHNAYDILSSPVIEKEAEIQFFSLKYSWRYKDILYKQSPSGDTYVDTKMTRREFLKWVLADKYPNDCARNPGKSIGAFTSDKVKAAKEVFHDYSQDVTATLGGFAHTSIDTSVEDSIFEKFTDTSQKMFGFDPRHLFSGKKFDLASAVTTLKENVETAQANLEIAKQDYNKAVQDVKEYGNQIRISKNRLKKLKSDVSGGLQVDAHGSTKKAIAAVDYIQKEHPKVASLSESVNKIVKQPSPLDKFEKLKSFKPLSIPVNKEQGATK